MDIKGSVSEDNGLAALTTNDVQVLSVGISTGGVAEIRMAEGHPERHIIATTIDEKGVAFAKQFIAERHLQNQIEAKLEDVSEPMPYADNYFDFIYARLVLHYLSKEKLASTLAELRRVLKSGGKLFVVVRSTKCPDAHGEDVHFDPQTGLTSRSYVDDQGRAYSYSRYFHTEESISKYVADAGFAVEYVKSYDEQLYMDFMHTQLSPKTDNVIELLAAK